jgi:hypothetical protein
MTIGTRLLDLLERKAEMRRRLIGLALIRIGFGFTMVLHYLVNLPYREVLYGPHGQTSFETFSASQHLSGAPFSLYAMNGSRAWFTTVYFLGLAIALAWAVLGGHVLTAANAIFIWSLDQRNPNILDGGDNLVRILLIFLIFTTTNAYFSPGARFVRARLAGQAGTPHLRTAVHNTAALLIVFQICVVYAFASFWKLVDTRWREGNALYYISQLRQFEYSNVFTQLMHNSVAVTVATYLTVLVQAMVVLLIVSRRLWLRELVLLLVIGLHVGIMMTMGLVSFGLFMIAADATLLSDVDYRRTIGRIRDLASRLRRTPATPTGAPEPAQVNEEILARP